MIWHLLTAPNEWSISFSGQYWFWSTVIMLSWAQYYSWPIAIHWQSSHIYPMAPQHIGSSVAVRQSFVSGTQWGALVQLLLIVLHRKPHICVLTIQCGGGPLSNPSQMWMDMICINGSTCNRLFDYNTWIEWANKDNTIITTSHHSWL